jgi:colanic acid biosynthesis glycosyl transferase WcaI
LPKITVLYHYFHPDDVVGGILMTDLCAGLASRGWDVEAIPCNRSRHNEKVRYPSKEEYRGVSIRRVWRPALFSQQSAIGRIFNGFWMLAAWSLLALRGRKHRPDVLLMGTDPVLSVLVALPHKLFAPGVKVAHWCFDMYPESAVADGLLRENSIAVRLAKRLLKKAYARCDLVADLGPCMRGRLEKYGHASRKVTLVPWAIDEPEAPVECRADYRRRLFGDARLAILYSGNFGRAHSYESLLALAREVSGDGIKICFSIRGSMAEKLRGAAGNGYPNVSFADYAPRDELAAHLSAADVHAVSLKPEWSGLVVPSKFFGSLAVGRPVLFAGSRDSAIARWITEHGIGWVLDGANTAEVAAGLRRLAGDRDAVSAMQRRCFEVYRMNFSKEKIIAAWDGELRRLAGSGAGGNSQAPALP